MTIEELKITNEDINLLNEMKENCLKASVYKDEKRLLKANAITKFLVEHQENQELKEKLEASEKARKDVYDYINFLVIIDAQLAGGRFKDTIWGKELLEILDTDKGE